MSYSSRSSLFLKIKAISQHKSSFVARIFSSAAIVVVALLIFITPPIQKIFAKLDFWTDGGMVSVYSRAGRINSQIAELKDDFMAIFQSGATIRQLQAENEQLRGQTLSLAALTAENIQLKKLANHSVPGADHIASAYLVVKQSNQAGVGKILAGTLAGIASGQFVLNNEGNLLGKVIEAGARSAKILLITEPHARLPVYFPRIESKAILTGNYHGQLEILFADDGVESQLQLDDVVVTSAEDDAIPPGMVVGRVIKSSGRGQTVVISPLGAARDELVASVFKMK